MKKTDLLNTCLILLIALAGAMGYLQLQQELRATNQDLSAIGLQISQQTAVTHRALGKVLPVEIPAEVEQQFAAIKGLLANESMWPDSPAKVEEVRAELAGIVDSLPAWAQEECLPELVPLRWDLEALWLLRQDHTGEPDTLAQQAGLMSYLLDNKPLSASPAIVQRLDSQRSELESEVKKAERNEAIAGAKTALESSTDIEKAIRGLEEYQGDDVNKLRKELADLILVRSLTEPVSFIKEELERSKSLEDPFLRLTAQGRLAEQAADLRLRIVFAQVDKPSLKDQLATAESELGSIEQQARAAYRKAQTASLRDYQVWALESIQKVERFSDLKDRELAAIPSAIDRNLWTEARARAVDRARSTLEIQLTHNLALIDQGLLDVAVGQLFRTVYQNGLADLADDTARQQAVIETFAKTPKRGLEPLT